MKIALLLILAPLAFWPVQVHVPKDKAQRVDYRAGVARRIPDEEYQLRPEQIADVLLKRMTIRACRAELVAAEKDLALSIAGIRKDLGVPDEFVLDESNRFVKPNQPPKENQ